MRTCPSCGRFITVASTPTCPHCGAPLEPGLGASAPPEPAAPGYGQPSGAPPYTPTAAPSPIPPAYQPPYAQPPYGPGYGAPPPYSQPMQPPTSPPMAPPYGQPPFGSGYGAPGGYPGAYPPGAGWKPNQEQSRTPWGRIIGGVVAALVLIAIVAGVLYNLSHTPAHGAGTSANAAATALSSGTLLSDSMLTVDPSWANDSHCSFEPDGYHIHEAYICYAPIGEQVDGTETVTVKQITGPTTWAYGLVFRRVSVGNDYLFGIDSNSKWVFAKDVNRHLTNLQDFTFNQAIKGGLNSANTLSVTMTGSTFVCYINAQKVGTIHDSTYPQGGWGLEGGPGIEVVFTNYLAHQ